MDKLKMHTVDLAEENYRKLAALFPDAVTETVDKDGRVVRAIDKDVLMQEINTTVVDDGQQRYRFTWPDKNKAILLANEPTTKTLRLEREKSVGRDGTNGGVDSENIYIEGDNLDALKILRETYLGKVKMIYIDPPYNTGNDFIYEDDFSQKTADYVGNSGQTDEEGNRLVQNTESNGRFHTDWLNMMYPRLKIAKDLLSEDGEFFISLDDKELENLKKICNEIFGNRNFVECLVWKKRATPPNDKNIGRIHEFVIIYAKDIDKIKLGLLPRDNKSISRYSNPDNDPRGPWVASDLSANGKGGRIVESCIYPIFNPHNGKDFYPSEGRCWLFNKEKMNAWIQEGRVSFRNGTGAPFLKRYLSEVRQGLTLPTIMTEFGYSQTSAAEEDKLFGKKGIFEYAKPTTLINPLVRVGAPQQNCIIIDFFSGSSTTAHAIFQLNSEDNKYRKFILVQIPELTDEKSAAYKAGYKTICDIGEERIRRAGKKIKEETGADIDYGFRCFKVDSGNMEDVYYSPNDLKQEEVSLFSENVKPDRTEEDLLFQVMLDLGILLSSKIEEKVIAGKKVFSVADGYLMACFDKDVTEETVTAIAKEHPFYAVFRDGGMNSDSVIANFEQIFETYSPETQRRIL